MAQTAANELLKQLQTELDNARKTTLTKLLSDQKVKLEKLFS
jgi:hypothetical protein